MEESGVAPMPGANDGRREPGPRGETPAGDDRIDITMIVETVMVLAVDGDGCQGPRLLAGAILIRQPSVGPRCPAACRTSPHVARPGNGCRLVRSDPSRIGSCATQDRTRAMGGWADGPMGRWADGPGGCLDMALSSGASARNLPVPMLRRAQALRRVLCPSLHWLTCFRRQRVMATRLRAWLLNSIGLLSRHATCVCAIAAWVWNGGSPATFGGDCIEERFLESSMDGLHIARHGLRPAFEQFF